MENEKIPEKFYYRIGEIADHLKVNTSLLRFWEKEFERFIRPDRNKRGVRLYSREEFDVFIKIHTLVKVEGMTLKGAREKLLSEKKAPHDREEVIHSLVKLKEFLLDIKKQIK